MPTISVTVDNRNASAKRMRVAYASTGGYAYASSDPYVIPGNHKSIISVTVSDANEDVPYTVVVTEGTTDDGYVWVNQSCTFKDENTVSFTIGAVSPFTLTMGIVFTVVFILLLLLVVFVGINNFRGSGGANKDASAYSTLAMTRPPTDSAFASGL